MALFDDHAAVHEDDVIGHFASKADFVCHHNHCHAFVGQTLHDGEHFTHEFRVKCGGGFVKENGLGIHCQSAGDAHALLLATRQTHGIVLGFGCQSNARERFDGFLACGFLIFAAYDHLAEHDVFEHRLVRP